MPTAAPTLGVGVVGVGNAARIAHLPALLDLDEVDVVALLDRDGERVEALAAELAGATPYTDLDRFLAHSGLDAVVVATPPDSHVAVASRAVERGMHVLVEKPLGRTTAECLKLAELAARRGVTVSVGLEKRFHPSLAAVGRLLGEGAIGDPVYGGVHWCTNVKLDPEHLSPPRYRSGYAWRWSDPEVGGGIVQDHLPHYVDLVSHWTGERPTSVYALSRNVARDKLGWDPAVSRWEDLGLAVVRFSGALDLRFETGVVGRSLSPIWSLGSGVGEWTEYGFLLGSEGQVVFDLLPWDSSEHGRVALWQKSRAVSRGEGWTYVEQPEPLRSDGSPAGAASAMFGGQACAWVARMRGEPSEIASLADGAVCVAAVEAAYEAAAERRELPLAIDDILKFT